MRDLNEWITTDEAAEILRLTPAGVRHRARQGDFDAQKRAGVWWLRKRAVKAYAEQIQGKDKHDPTRGR
jgi:hypothetical protein